MSPVPNDDTNDHDVSQSVVVNDDQQQSPSKSSPSLATSTCTIPREQMDAMIAEVRQLMLAEAEANPDAYDRTDIELVRTDDWQIERFILRKKTPEASLEMLKGTLAWRHSYAMPQLKETDFPEEFFKIGAMFGYERDRANNGVVYMRIRMHQKIKELDRYLKLFMLYVLNSVDMKMNGKGLTVVFDCQGAGITNLDMDLVFFLVDLLIKYYPYGLGNIIVHELPWVLTSAWSIIKRWVPEEFRDKIVFTKKSNITDYIDRKNLPYYMGGECMLNYHHVPKGCRPASELAPEQGLEDKDVRKMMKAFKPYLDEAEMESLEIQKKMAAAAAASVIVDADDASLSSSMVTSS